MALQPGHSAHRSGPLKQANKEHKTGRHRSKNKIGNQLKGRVDVKTISKHARKEQKKADRRNKAIQLRKKKRDAVIAQKRNVGSRQSAPHMILVLSLHQEVDVELVMEKLFSSDEDAISQQDSSSQMWNLIVPKFKQRFTSVNPPQNLSAILDAAKIADSLLCVISSTEAWDSWGDLCLSCLFAQGLPTTTIVTQGFTDIPIKKRHDAKKLLQKTVERRFPEGKIFTLDSDQEGANLLRHLSQQKIKPIKWRENRPHIMARNVDFQPNEENEHLGTLKVSGFLRGPPLSVNGLIHLSGIGDFQMKQIDTLPDPCPLNPHTLKKAKRKIQNVASMDQDEDGSMDEGVVVAEVADSKEQESLESEALVDPMEGEQTWPTEEEMAEAEAALREEKKVVTKRVPKGTSDYQAAWIIDSEGEEDDGEEEEDEDDDEQSEDGDFKMKMTDADVEESERGSIAPTDDMEFETISITQGKRVHYDDNFDAEKEIEMLEKYRAERMNQLYPDEIDTPMDVPARTRFQRYRGLKSFRTSPWDPKENLPSDYARIFQFQDFTRTTKRILKQERDGCVQHGDYVTVYVANVPKAVIDEYPAGHPLILFGLLSHEQKMSVIHVAIKRHPSNLEPVKSKERLVFQIGYRRFTANPIFSEHTVGTKHKFERFLPQDGSVVVATLFAPIFFPKAPVLVFKEQVDGSHALLATGTLLTCNPDRIITKKVVLSGHPFKIINRSAVIRYMFFNREDILWFKPVELHTKYGRRGHIKEPLGTHGHMKCIFDGALKSQDTILMNLYKRMYPKWTYDPLGAPFLKTGPDSITTVTAPAEVLTSME